MKRDRTVIAASLLSVLIGTLGMAVLRPAIATDRQPQMLAEVHKQSDDDRPGRGHHEPPDFAAAAAELGVSEADLKAALGVPETLPERDAMGRPIGGRPPRPDFAAAATQLGVSEEALKAALGIPDCGMGDRGMGDRGRHEPPDFAAVAVELGISEADLKAALGVPETPPERDAMGRPIGGPPPRPDFAAAATQLGISEDVLFEALHPEGCPGGRDREDRQNGEGNRNR